MFLPGYATKKRTVWPDKKSRDAREELDIRTKDRELCLFYTKPQSSPRESGESKKGGREGEEKRGIRDSIRRHAFHAERPSRV